MPASRPRYSSGIVWFHMSCRKMPLTMSAAPATPSRAKVTHRLCVRPIAATAAPQATAAMATMRPWRWTLETHPLVRAVVRGSRRAMVVADMPFGSYQSGSSTALTNAARFIKEGGAHAVKLEGGRRIAEQVRALVESGIPVMGHIGLTPQSVLALGGYRVQGRGDAGSALIEDAVALQEAGAFALVLEVIPPDLAARITETVAIPTIGIGAGNSTDAQVNVWQDLTGLTPGAPPKFVKRYADLNSTIEQAARNWCEDVVARTYPGPEQTYS